MSWDKLKQPFKSEQVRWRVGKITKDKKKGMALAYVDARDVQDRLDEAVGVDNWSTRYEYHDKTCLCYLTINGVTKADGSGDTAVEAEKGAISKAFVRAASAWGIGRYFYNAKNIWVELDEYKKIKKSEESKLNKIHDRIAKGVVTGEDPKDKAEQEAKRKTIAGCSTKIKGFEDEPTLTAWWEEKKTQDHVMKQPDTVKDKCIEMYTAKKNELLGA